jgi:hypothetical protein
MAYQYINIGSCLAAAEGIGVKSSGWRSGAL